MDKFDRFTRAEVLGQYIVETGCTVRDAAGHFRVSKSTVHKDVTTELRARNAALYFEVWRVLQKNKEERHLRGGEATRQKYARRKKEQGTEAV